MTPGNGQPARRPPPSPLRVPRVGVSGSRPGAGHLRPSPAGAGGPGTRSHPDGPLARSHGVGGGSPRHLGQGRGTRGTLSQWGHIAWEGPQTPTGSPGPPLGGGHEVAVGSPGWFWGRGGGGWGARTCRDRARVWGQGVVAWGRGQQRPGGGSRDPRACCLSPACPPRAVSPPPQDPPWGGGHLGGAKAERRVTSLGRQAQNGDPPHPSCRV